MLGQTNVPGARTVEAKRLGHRCRTRLKSSPQGITANEARKPRQARRIPALRSWPSVLLPSLYLESLPRYLAVFATSRPGSVFYSLPTSILSSLPLRHHPQPSPHFPPSSPPHAPQASLMKPLRTGGGGRGGASRPRDQLSHARLTPPGRSQVVDKHGAEYWGWGCNFALLPAHTCVLLIVSSSRSLIYSLLKLTAHAHLDVVAGLRPSRDSPRLSRVDSPHLASALLAPLPSLHPTSPLARFARSRQHARRTLRSRRVRAHLPLNDPAYLRQHRPDQPRGSDEWAVHGPGGCVCVSRSRAQPATQPGKASPGR